MEQEGLGMAGVGEKKLAPLQVRHQIKGGGEERRAGLPQNGAQVGIDPCQ